MKPIGIVFIIVNLLLAGAFLGYMSHALDTNTNWKTEFEKKDQELKDEMEKAAAEAAKLRADKNEVTANRDALREERDRLQSDRDNLQGLLEAANRENTELNSQVAGINSTLDDFRRDIETAQRAKDEAEDARVAAERERDDAKDAASSAQLAQRDAEDAQRKLEQQLADTELALAEKGSNLDQLQVKFDTLVEMTGVNLEDILAQPLINALIVDVSHDVKPGLVVLNVGSKNSQIKRGMTMQIYKNGTYKGEVRIDNVDETMCSALIVRDKGIAQGDSATTRL
ncbi:MAG: hypothetical protein R3F34_08170 [Planctomycetota bacterium]